MSKYVTAWECRHNYIRQLADLVIFVAHWTHICSYVIYHREYYRAVYRGTQMTRLFMIFVQREPHRSSDARERND